MKLRKYRVNRDWYFSATKWQVQVWRIWWPFWVEERGLLRSKEDAVELIKLLEEGGE
mgnify:CR=1 FL=1